MILALTLFGALALVTPPPPFSVSAPAGWTEAPERGTPNHRYWVRDPYQKYPAFSVYVGPGTQRSSKAAAVEMMRPLITSGARVFASTTKRLCGITAYEAWTAYRDAKRNWAMVSLYVATPKALYVGTYVRNLSDPQDPNVMRSLDSICPARV